MLHVKIGELRNKLSALLRRVKAGETILVYDRDKPVARIQPAAEAKPTKFKNDKERLAWLIARGIVLPPKNPNPDWSFLNEPLPKSNAGVLEALLQERREGR
jgi:prevent-host-death family protein